MTSPFLFQKGSGKKLQLEDVLIYNDAIDWDEKASFTMRNHKRKKEWITSVLKWLGPDSEEGINAVIDKSLSGFFDEVIKQVVDYLLEKNDEGFDICNVFSGKRQKMGKLRVAIVQCNFADVNQMIYNVENELFNNIGIKHGEAIRISSCGIPINTLIDRIRDINCSLITIEQVESMSSEYLDQLFSLLASFNISVPVLVCVSTNSMTFTSLCSQRTLELLRSKSFSLALADKIFARVMNALMSFKGIRFCGELLRFIRIQFFANDFSVAGIKKAVRFSVLQQFLKNPMWCFQNEAEFMEQVKAYNVLLSTLCTKLNQYEEDVVTDKHLKFLELHETIQLDDNWFREISSYDSYKKWRQSLSLLKLPELSDFVYEIVALLKDDCEELKISLNNLIESVKETDKSDEKNIEVEVSKPGRKMNFCEFTTHFKKKMNGRLRNTHIIAREGVIRAIESGIASVLQPWTKFTDSRYFLHGQDCTVMLTAHPARDMEQALLAKQEYNRCALSVALQTLFNRNRWKTIALSDWGSNFAEKIEVSLDCNTVPAFFSSLGHLEYIGVVRCSSERKSTITVSYHPTSYLT